MDYLKCWFNHIISSRYFCGDFFINKVYLCYKVSNFYAMNYLRNSRKTVWNCEWMNMVNMFNNPLTPTKYRMRYEDLIALKCCRAYFIVRMYDCLESIDWFYWPSIRNMSQSTISVYISLSIEIYLLYEREF